MPTITLSVSDALKKDMEQFHEINWSAVARQAIVHKISDLKLFQSITVKSKLTEKDALELGKKINKSLHNRYKEGYSGDYA